MVMPMQLPHSSQLIVKVAFRNVRRNWRHSVAALATLGRKLVAAPTQAPGARVDDIARVGVRLSLGAGIRTVEWLGDGHGGGGKPEKDMAQRLESAVARVIKEGKVKTYDMGGKASTTDVAKEVARYV